MGSSISKKKGVELYMAVHESIVQAHMDIAKVLDDSPTIGDIIEVYEILQRLTAEVPKKAVQVFYKKEE